MPPKKKGYRKLLCRARKGHRLYGKTKLKAEKGPVNENVVIPEVPLPSVTLPNQESHVPCVEGIHEGAALSSRCSSFDSEKQSGSCVPKSQVFTVVGMELLLTPDKPLQTDQQSSCHGSPSVVLDTSLDSLTTPSDDENLSAQPDVCSNNYSDRVTQSTENSIGTTSVDSAAVPDKKFLREVQRNISKILPKNWYCSVREDSLHVLLVPSAEHLVQQRSLAFKADGELSIAVHNVPIQRGHAVWDKLPARTSALCNSVGDFSAYVTSCTNVVRAFHICLGMSDAQYGPLLKRRKDLIFDDNKFKEVGFEITYRSSQCLKLVQGARTKRCFKCTKVKQDLYMMIKRQQNRGSPHPNTNNKFLNSTEKLKKLNKERKSRRCSYRREGRLREKIQAMIHDEGVDIDESLHEELKEIVLKERANLNTVQATFLQEQLKYFQMERGCGMKWHPLLVRFALKIHSTSPAALDAINESGVMRLPSSRTLYNYSHFEKLEAGISWSAITKLHHQMQNYQGDEEHKRFHVLMMDEMNISKNLVFSTSTGELTGFVDLPPVEEALAGLESVIASLDVGIDENDEEESNVDDIATDSDNSSGSVHRRGKRAKMKKKKRDVSSMESHPEFASKMLTFMAKGIANDVKHIVASYGVSTLYATDLYLKTWKVIEKLERNNIQVLAVVCDGLSVNRKFINMHKPLTATQSGVVFDTKNFHGGYRPLYFFSDVPHLLKTTRNAFASSGFGKGFTKTLTKNKQTIVWSTIQKLFEYEHKNPLRLAYKLNKQVVELNNFSKMKVSYAAAVLSRTVANALQEMEKLGKLHGVSETIEFIRRVNDFFDCLNGCSSLEGKHKRNPNLNPYTKVNDERFKTLLDFLKYLEDWKDEVMRGPGRGDKSRALLPEPTQQGIEMTVRAFIGATQYLLGPAKAKFIMARAFCQDPLEQYFSKQRASVGGSRNPNKSKFMRNQKKIEVCQGLGFQKRGNTEFLKENLGAFSDPLPRLKTKRDRRHVLAKRSLFENIKTALDVSNSDLDVSNDTSSCTLGVSDLNMTM